MSCCAELPFLAVAPYFRGRGLKGHPRVVMNSLVTRPRLYIIINNMPCYMVKSQSTPLAEKLDSQAVKPSV